MEGKLPVLSHLPHIRFTGIRVSPHPRHDRGRSPSLASLYPVLEGSLTYRVYFYLNIFGPLIPGTHLI